MLFKLSSDENGCTEKPELLLMAVIHSQAGLSQHEDRKMS